MEIIMDAGLENIVAAETKLSKVDGQKGRLIICGHNVETLAQSYSFEDVAHALWSKLYIDIGTVDDFRKKLSASRMKAFADLQSIFELISKRPNMEGLRLGLAACPDGDDLETAIYLLAALPVITAAAAQLRKGRTPIAPRPGLSHTEGILYMLSGKLPSLEMTSGITAYFNTVSDHGLNASTFAARVVASTQAGLASSVIAGLSALKGPLHGGAPGPVLDMLDAIGTPENAEGWINGALDRKERLMGFGHRVYKVRDPRADALKRAVKRLPQSTGRLKLAEQIEVVILEKLATDKPHLRLETNVEYYTAVLLDALGISREDFTCVFGCARAAGWLAHAREQLATGRIIRPKSVYVGPSVAA